MQRSQTVLTDPLNSVSQDRSPFAMLAPVVRWEIEQEERTQQKLSNNKCIKS